MKKIFKYLFVLLLGVFFIPMVHAAELPQSGVVYFMEFPNGRLEATENYNEAVNPDEVKLYSDETNSNGEILLCGWSHEGEIRLEQHVPDGYTTNQREITVDLSDTNQVSFINYRGTNPSTGRTFLFLVVIASVVAITFAARRNKKILMVIPVVVALAIAFNIHKASAQEECVTIKVKDSAGTALRNVVVDVYAKPKAVTANPGVKFDANGGHFFDGSTVIYMPIPYEGCSSDDFYNSLDTDSYEYFEFNTYGVYRKGYYPDGFDMPPEFHNGDVIYMDWYQDSDASLYEINGNGGTYDFYGKQLDRVYVYYYDYVYYIAPFFHRGGYYYIGYDVNPACNNYSSYGVTRDAETANNWIRDWNMNSHRSKRIDTELVGEAISDATRIQTIYACWHNQPDGIYVNGELFPGNPETCFFDSETFRYHSDSGMYAFFTRRRDKAISFQYDDEDHQMLFSPIIIISSDKSSVEVEVRKESTDKSQNTVFESIDGGGPLEAGKLPFDIEEIDNLEIIYNGKSILYITKDEILENEDGVLHLTNSYKEQVLYDFFDQFDVNVCNTLYSTYQSGIPEVANPE